MAGEIKHAWNGTVLTITSDSGTSSMDLKGSVGDMGPRGPQGPCGVIYTEDGVVLADNLATTDYVDTKIAAIEQGEVDLTGYATQEYVDARIENVDVDLTDYATKTYVTEKVVEMATGGTVTLDGYATEEYVNEKVANVDLTGYATEEYVNTSIEGIGLPKGKTIVKETGLSLTGYVESFITLPEALIEGDTYRFTTGYSDGFVESQTVIFELESGATLGNSERLYTYMYNASDLSLGCMVNGGYTVTSFKLERILPGVPLNPQAIPIDDETIKVNADGKIYCEVQEVDLTGYATETYVTEKIVEVSSGGSVSLDGYATEEYVDNAVANAEVDLSGYYTKEEIDAFMAAIPAFNNAEEIQY